MEIKELDRLVDYYVKRKKLGFSVTIEKLKGYTQGQLEFIRNRFNRKIAEEG